MNVRRPDSVQPPQEVTVVAHARLADLPELIGRRIGLEVAAALAYRRLVRRVLRDVAGREVVITRRSAWATVRALSTAAAVVRPILLPSAQLRADGERLNQQLAARLEKWRP